jgi:2-polyprenyl-6-methoxyphenol hydroxylase-like FAD-dependent oxidoreductase
MATFSTQEQIPVLIVGAGPAGLVTALDLARHGVESIIVEKHAGTSTFPRASGISVRTMEILREAGLEDGVRAFSVDASPLMAVQPALAGPILATVPLGFPSREQAAAVSPTRGAISPQDHVEPVLVERLRRLGRTRFRFSTELVAIEGDTAGVTATIVDRETGQRSRIRAQYAVGADGGRSTVRELLGIPVAGPTDLQQHAAILFRADLWSVVGERRFGLYMVGGSPETASIVVPTGPDDRWLLATPGDPATAARLAANPDEAIAAVRAAAGVPDLAVEIVAVMPLSFSAQVATRWREGRVFLVGDAAHRMPPYGGRGMNTAIADAHNLGWKLAWVVAGLAEPALLDSYEAERGPVGRANLALALERFPDRLAEHRTAMGMPAGDLPTSTPDGLREDLGYAYASTAVVGEADGPAAPVAAGPMFAPSAGPGARLPHAWLDRPEGGRISTLDLVGDGLVVIARGDGSAWRRAARSLQPAFSILRLLGAPGPALPPAAHVGIQVRTVGDSGLADPDGAFAAATGLEPGGALAVRPDGHVVARWVTAPRDVRAALDDALAAVTGRAGSTAVAAPTVVHGLPELQPAG